MKNKKGLIIGLILGIFLFTRKTKAGTGGTGFNSGSSGSGSAYAKFSEWVKLGTRRYRRIKAGYTLLPNWDKGHWTSGTVGLGTKAGTNMSISAPVYLKWKKNTNPNYILTEQKMRDMLESEALQIYKTNYWDKIRGDEIKSQLIANFVADMKSSGGGVWNFQRALNILGASPVLAVDGAFGTKTLTATNKMIDAGKTVQLNNEFRTQQIAYYNSLSNTSNNWFTSLDADYPQL